MSAPRRVVPGWGDIVSAHFPGIKEVHFSIARISRELCRAGPLAIFTRSRLFCREELSVDTRLSLAILSPAITLSKMAGR
ncbi:MAG TPA: hypothetical protein HPP81_02210 [Deltaproteobacteria bacterium]|jgi:hypothetical protein|nr:hypothetical protein [Deltaproteobacteria bacterium]